MISATGKLSEGRIQANFEYVPFATGRRGTRQTGWTCSIQIDCGPFQIYLEPELDNDDPAHWPLCEIQVSRLLVNLATLPDGRGVVRLSKLPEVLEVVQDGWRQAKAVERLLERHSDLTVDEAEDEIERQWRTRV